MVASSLHDVTLVGRHSYFIILRHFVDRCFVGVQLSDRVFLAVADSIAVYSVPFGGMYCIYSLCFVQSLLFENRVCCESSGMTVRLRVARSVPVLTAVVTVVSDSPACSIFHSVLQSTSAIL